MRAKDLIIGSRHPVRSATRDELRRTIAAQDDVILWDDTFVRYNEPHIGKAAVKVLERSGYRVSLARGRQCCGRPAFSQGNLDQAAKFGEHNIKLLSSPNMPARLDSNTPILFLEPSCYSMFAEDYRELKIPGAESMAQRSFLFEKFVTDILDANRKEPDSRNATSPLPFTRIVTRNRYSIDFHGRLAEKIPGRNAKLLDTGCCGMAGAFGMMESKRELSLKVARTTRKNRCRRAERDDCRFRARVAVIRFRNCRSRIRNTWRKCWRTRCCRASGGTRFGASGTCGSMSLHLVRQKTSYASCTISRNSVPVRAWTERRDWRTREMFSNGRLALIWSRVTGWRSGLIGARSTVLQSPSFAVVSG